MRSFTSGFRPEYGWVKVPGAFDEMGFPGAGGRSSTVVPGLNFMGVHFQRKRKSAVLLGVGEDAMVLAERTLARTSGKRPRREPVVLVSPGVRATGSWPLEPGPEAFQGHLHRRVGSVATSGQLCGGRAGEDFAAVTTAAMRCLVERSGRCSRGARTLRVSGM